jgi:hypothetical protein
MFYKPVDNYARSRIYSSLLEQCKTIIQTNTTMTDKEGVIDIDIEYIFKDHM